MPTGKIEPVKLLLSIVTLLFGSGLVVNNVVLIRRPYWEDLGAIRMDDTVFMIRVAIYDEGYTEIREVYGVVFFKELKTMIRWVRIEYLAQPEITEGGEGKDYVKFHLPFLPPGTKVIIRISIENPEYAQKFYAKPDYGVDAIHSKGAIPSKNFRTTIDPYPIVGALVFAVGSFLLGHFLGRKGVKTEETPS